jgi:ParB family chromosome partitioning protein
MSIINSYSNNLKGYLEDIPISELSIDRYSPRIEMTGINELADSIRKNGLLQPILVRHYDYDSNNDIGNNSRAENYEIVAGNRRYHACKLLRWKKIASHIIEIDDKSAFEISIIENIQRHSLNPVEEGNAFKKYIKEFGWGGISELASKICKSPSYISRRIQLLDLPSTILDLILQSEINPSIAQELLSIKDTNNQYRIGKLTCMNSLSTREVREIIRKMHKKFR